LKNEKETSVGPDNLAQIRFPVFFSLGQMEANLTLNLSLKCATAKPRDRHLLNKILFELCYISVPYQSTIEFSMGWITAETVGVLGGA